MSKEEKLNKLTSEISQKDLMLDSLSSQVTEQDLEFNDLSLQLTDLASALGLEKIRSNSIENDLGKTRDTLNKAEDQILLHLSTISKLTKNDVENSFQIDCRLIHHSTIGAGRICTTFGRRAYGPRTLLT